MVEPVEGVDDNDDDDEAHNDLISRAVLNTGRMWSHHVNQGTILAGGNISVFLKVMLWPDPHGFVQSQTFSGTAMMVLRILTEPLSLHCTSPCFLTQNIQSGSVLKTNGFVKRVTRISQIAGRCKMRSVMAKLNFNIA